MMSLWREPRDSCSALHFTDCLDHVSSKKINKQARKLRNQRKWDMFCTTDTSWIHDEWGPDELTHFPVPREVRRDLNG